MCTRGACMVRVLGLFHRLTHLFYMNISMGGEHLGRCRDSGTGVGACHTGPLEVPDWASEGRRSLPLS